jgi:peptidoglycan-N-acetylglucosamine deacetylase
MRVNAVEKKAASVETARPLASLSLDLDNQWSYMKTHGDAGWESFPSYLDVLVPRVLSFLKERDLKITFFIVGQDAALDKNREALAQIAAAGHEIGNHSFHHEPWLHQRSEHEVEDELKSAEDQIERVTGRRPKGFRGPGFSLSKATLRVLARRGYSYDASTFPTFIGPLSRAYYFMTAKLSEEEREKRQALFGTVRDGLRPIKPFRWQLDGGASLIEIPVTTMPIFKMPIHVSYLLYLSRLAKPLAQGYFQLALQLCRLTGTGPSLLLHPLDFLGRDDTRDLSFFPGMNLTSEEKLETVGKVLNALAAKFTIANVERHARTASLSSSLPSVRWNSGPSENLHDPANEARPA